MARKRMIDPSFWDDEDVCLLSDSERLMLLCIISNSDDEGKMSGSSVTLKKIGFGLSDHSLTEIEQMITNICNRIRGVVRYTVDGKQYIKLIHWLNYQKVDHPTKSILPDPDSSASSTRVVPECSLSSTSQLSNELISLSNQSINECVVSTVKGQIFKDLFTLMGNGVTEKVRTDVTYFIQDHGEDKVLSGIQTILNMDVKPVSIIGYLRGILNRMNESSTNVNAEPAIPDNMPGGKNRPRI